MTRSTFVYVTYIRTHTIDRAPSKLIDAVSGGWPKVISNLKSLLESGSAIMNDPYPPVNAHAGKA